MREVIIEALKKHENIEKHRVKYRSVVRGYWQNILIH